MAKSNLYKGMPESQMLSPLNMGDYRFIYENLKYKNTFSYIDENENINLVADCGNDDILVILKAKKSVYIDKCSLGVLIQVKLIEYGISFEFVYDVYNNDDLNIIDSMIKSEKDLIINFLVKKDNKFLKGFHINFKLEENLKERLEYIKSTTYNFQYPRISSEEEAIEETAKSLEYEMDKNLIADVIEACDKLSKWKSMDEFVIYISIEDNFVIYIIGKCKNYNFIKSELNNKYKLISEENKQVRGIPLIKYKKGYLYFYDYDN